MKTNKYDYNVLTDEYIITDEIITITKDFISYNEIDYRIYEITNILPLSPSTIKFFKYKIDTVKSNREKYSTFYLVLDKKENRKFKRVQGNTWIKRDGNFRFMVNTIFLILGLLIGLINIFK